MEVEYEEYKKNLDKYTKLGMKSIIHIMMDGKHVMDLTPAVENKKNEALHRVTGAIPNPEKTVEQYKEERLKRH
jgi:predicted SpoU family rRNA methylase